jgi:hypothetical protein
MDNLKGPTMDYAGVFDEFTGECPGITVWQIDNFYPVLQERLKALELKEILFSAFF